MDKIVITGIAGYDGEYPFDASYFTNGELHTIKRMAGVRAGEIQASFEAGDNDLVVAIAAIALERNGKVLHEQALWNAKAGCIEVVPAEDDARPPESQPANDESAGERKPSSGQPLSDGSVPPENGQSRTGLRPSELSAA